jgi:hypothetical protein
LVAAWTGGDQWTVNFHASGSSFFAIEVNKGSLLTVSTGGTDTGTLNVTSGGNLVEFGTVTVGSSKPAELVFQALRTC